MVNRPEINYNWRMPADDRIQREARTLRAMFRLFCRSNHGRQADLCPQCAELQAYALQRLAHCPFQEGKTVCARCPVHCYKPEMRTRIKLVMRTAGPRMLLRHPLLTIQHTLDARRREPEKATGKIKHE